jgi:hypothetical protein
MYSVTLRHFLATIFADEKEMSITYSECVFVALGIPYPACKAHTAYCHLRAALFHVFSHYLINGTIFEKKSYSETCLI